MSTKNLARTVIEGGRRYYNSWERRHSHAEHRAKERVVEARARSDDADEIVWPERKHVGRSFHDKLSPAERWLRSNVGRPWRLVRSEIFASFDTRTLAGQHIVFDHLLGRRWDLDETWRVSRDFVFRVDRHGILRVDLRVSRSRSTRQTGPSWIDERAAARFAGDRKVVVRGAHVFWLVQVPAGDRDAAPRFRQDRVLDVDERRAFDALTQDARSIVEFRFDADREDGVTERR